MLAQIFRQFSMRAGEQISKTVALPPVGRHIFDLLSNGDRQESLIVTPYHWPDLDGIASCVGLSELLTKCFNYKLCRPMIWNEPQLEACWVMKKFSMNVPQMHNITDNDRFVLVDVSDPHDIPTFINHDKVKFIIDHRLCYDIVHFKQAVCWIEQTGSAATLISLLFLHSNCQPSRLIANLLYLAIMSNTIKGKSHNTTSFDLSVLAWLHTLIDIDDTFVDEMFQAKSVIGNIEKAIDDDMSSKLTLIAGQRTAVGQLEIVNARVFLLNNKQSVLKALDDIRRARGADSIFMTVIDTTIGHTYFVFTDEHVANRVKQALQIFHQQDGDYFYECNDVFIRKEIVPLVIDRPEE